MPMIWPKAPPYPIRLSKKFDAVANQHALDADSRTANARCDGSLASTQMRATFLPFLISTAPDSSFKVCVNGFEVMNGLGVIFTRIRPSLSRRPFSLHASAFASSNTMSPFPNGIDHFRWCPVNSMSHHLRRQNSFLRRTRYMSLKQKIKG